MQIRGTENEFYFLLNKECDVEIAAIGSSAEYCCVALAYNNTNTTRNEHEW